MNHRHGTLVCWALGLVAAAVLCRGFVTAADKDVRGPLAAATREPQAAGSEALPPQEDFRVREGSQLVEELGEFQLAGDRVIFQPRGRQAFFVTLENLALERIYRVLEENLTPRMWSVSGTLTEFRGANYLLISKAVMKAKVPSTRSKVALTP